MRGRHGMAAAAGIVATAAAIGAFGPLPGGPLALGGGVAVCTDTANAPALITLTPDYRGASGAIREVRLLGAEGLVLDGAFLVPFADGTSVGWVSAAQPGPGWAERRDAIGARLDRTVSTWQQTEGLDLVVQVALEPGVTSGRFDDVEVLYTDGGGAMRVARTQDYDFGIDPGYDCAWQHESAA